MDAFSIAHESDGYTESNMKKFIRGWPVLQWSMRFVSHQLGHTEGWFHGEFLRLQGSTTMKHIVRKKRPLADDPFLEMRLSFLELKCLS